MPLIVATIYNRNTGEQYTPRLYKVRSIGRWSKTEFRKIKDELYQELMKPYDFDNKQDLDEILDIDFFGYNTKTLEYKHILISFN